LKFFAGRMKLELLRNLPPEMYLAPHARDAWDQCPLSTATDAELIDAVAATIAPPKATASNSFILHAPLELLARASLLPRVTVEARPAARRRIAEIAVRYAHAGEEIAIPTKSYPNIATAIAALTDALQVGDVNETDAALTFLLRRVPLRQLRATVMDNIVPMLGAAGHAPILLAALPRFTGRIADLGKLLRAPMLSLARGHASRVAWHRSDTGGTLLNEPANELFSRLAAPPRLKTSSNSIAPTVLAVERSGDAARLLADPVRNIPAEEAERVLLRIAAWSMLQDDRANAPYGWTHCLTLPQALLQNADAASDHRALIAVAATEVLAFRATEGSMDIDDHRTFAADEIGIDASIAFHTAPAERNALITKMATNAACHHDAHLAKYTVACFDAAERDPEAARLFLAATAYLGAWWRQHDHRPRA
jgi:hypothetical protein